ncbi:MAG TPA: ABC transporter substrate-binding protein [Chloroflexota bacterium]|nr:ABC transporter substrate-binding protein [Chloroflexota bacterium]
MAWQATDQVAAGTPRRGWSRRRLLGAAGGALGAAMLLGGVSVPQVGGLAGGRRAWAQTRLRIGYLPLISVGPLFVAYDRGYLRDAGLDVELVRFASGAEMVPALGTGELSAGYGVVSPGLYNAWARGVRTTIVADGSRMMPGYGYVMAVVRTDLVGQIRTPADLRGRRVGMSVVGSAVDYVMRHVLAQGGLTEGDVEAVRLSSADVNAGLAGGSIDAAGVAEPFGALTEQNNIARKWLLGDQVVPGMQVAGLLASEQALRDRPQLVALVTAWLRAVRDFLPGQNSDPEILEILQRWTGVAPDVLRACTPTYLDPNGTVDVANLQAQLAFWQQQGIVTAAPNVAERVDLSFVDAAVQTLGRA